MKTEILKELRYSLRSNRFLILLLTLLFFAVLTPVMMKVVLPQLLNSQYPGLNSQELSDMIGASQLVSIRNYMGDVLEIGSIVVAFALCGLIAQEIRDNTLVLPLCAGKRLSHVVLAKLLVFGGILTMSTTIALLANYYYSGLLYSFEVDLLPVIRGGLLQGLYMVFLLSCLLMWGAVLKKPISAGFATLFTSFGLYAVSGLLKIQQYVPSGLLLEAQQLTASADLKSLTTLGITIGITALFIAITLFRLNRIEWNLRQ